VYVKGSKNLADALSRRADHVHLSSMSATSTCLLSDIKAAYAADPLYSDSKFTSMLRFDDKSGVWLYFGRVAVPNNKALRQRILHECHDTVDKGHFGYDKTLNAVARRFFWPRQATSVKKYVRSCPVCQRMKASQQLPAGLLQPLHVSTVSWAEITMDFITDLPPCDGYDAIWTITDRFTKMAHFVPIT
jgi:hypothetical protein